MHSPRERKKMPKLEKSKDDAEDEHYEAAYCQQVPERKEELNERS